MNNVHLSDPVSADIHRRLLLETVEVIENTMVTVGRREDIHSFEEIQAKEEQKQTDCGQNADFDLTCVFHILI